MTQNLGKFLSYCIIEVLFERRQRVGSMSIFFEVQFLGVQLSLIFPEFILFKYTITML